MGSRASSFFALTAGTFASALLASACAGLIGADFDRGGAGVGGEGGPGGDADGALADGSVAADGQPSGDGSGGTLTDGATAKDGASVTDGGALDGASTGRSALDIFGPTLLRVWLMASKDVFTNGGALVLAWNDQSGNTTHGGPAGNGGGQLTLVPSDVNGLPAVQIDSDALTLGAKSPSIAATDDFYIGVVARYQQLGGSQDRFLFSRFTSFPHGYAMYAGSSANAAVAGTIDVGNIVLKSPDTTTADNKYRLYALRRTGSSGGGMVTMEVRVNGVVTSGSVPNGSAVVDPVRPLLFGGSMDGAALDRFMVGAFEEIVVVQGTASDASVVELETNLRSKYGL